MNLEFKNIKDDLKWDSLVQSLPNYSFLNSSARYNFEKDIGKNTHRYAIFKKDEFIGIITGSVSRSKIFGNFLECKHSPMINDSENIHYWQEVLDFLLNIAKENSCFMLRFAPLYKKNEFLLEFYSKNGFKLAPIHNVDALVSQHIDLTKDVEELRRDMSKTKRNLLNRLLKNGDVRVEVFNDNSQFDLFKDLHEQTVKLKGYTDRPSSHLLKELDFQVKHNMCHMLIGYFKDRPIGVWQCTVYGENVHLYQAATDTEFRDKNINITYLLYWESLKLGKSLGCKTFDLFGGVVPEGYENKKHPWSGVGAFKESLGGKKVTYIHSRDYAINNVKYLAYYYYSLLRTKIKGYTIDW